MHRLQARGQRTLGLVAYRDPQTLAERAMPYIMQKGGCQGLISLGVFVAFRVFPYDLHQTSRCVEDAQTVQQPRMCCARI